MGNIHEVLGHSLLHQSKRGSHTSSIARFVDEHRTAVLGGAGSAAAVIATILAADAYHRYEAGVAHQIVTNWQGQMTGKLDGKTALSADEKHYGRMRVVAAGRDEYERTQMQAIQEPVNVRPYPSAYTSQGTLVEPLGTIDQGTEIEEGILTAGSATASFNIDRWIATKRKHIKGPIKNADGVEVNINPEEVLGIHSNYLQVAETP